MKLSTTLFITSFFPVIAFKVIARVGEATLTQAKMALALGLFLAGAQIATSWHLMKHVTYLEIAFLGFLGFGTACVFLTPPQVSSLFVQNSTTLLYLTLCLTALVPQLFGADPFTYAIAKQWYPETVWNTPQFRTINLHITYFYSLLFFLAALSCWIGKGKPLFSIALPLILLLGVGLPFSKKYPDYFLKREFTSPPIDRADFPATARELVYRMPLGFNPKAAAGLKAEVQFDLSGDGGGKVVLSIAGGQCTAREGEALSPTLTIHSPSDVWVKMSRGEINRPKALIDGIFKVDGDMNLLMKMAELFQPLAKG